MPIFQYTAAVAQAVAGTYGTLGRNILRGPNFKNTDLSVSRNFPLHFGEGARVAFRTEFSTRSIVLNSGSRMGRLGIEPSAELRLLRAHLELLQLILKVES